MQAVILKNKGVMEVAEVETPTPAAGNVLLRVHASSICGSDIHRYVRGHREYPMILGHESAGVIAQVGAGVSADKLGKHAAIIPL
ncbi:MAG TPA: alcohol dehydrogenase catalytic domain-containing protein, partial [Thermoflexales bacterium]|nr:alcohol dehydrogenase catalytic domain-containing protein [Thermoflexales bacterium]